MSYRNIMRGISGQNTSCPPGQVWMPPIGSKPGSCVLTEEQKAMNYTKKFIDGGGVRDSGDKIPPSPSPKRHKKPKRGRGRTSHVNLLRGGFRSYMYANPKRTFKKPTNKRIVGI